MCVAYTLYTTEWYTTSTTHTHTHLVYSIFFKTFYRLSESSRMELTIWMFVVHFFHVFYHSFSFFFFFFWCPKQSRSVLFDVQNGKRRIKMCMKIHTHAHTQIEMKMKAKLHKKNPFRFGAKSRGKHLLCTRTAFVWTYAWVKE